MIQRIPILERLLHIPAVSFPAMNRFGPEIQAGYRSIAPTYHCQRVAREQVNVDWLDRLSEYLPSSGCVVDLGCGSGVPITRYFADRGYKVTGYDISPEMLDIARVEVPKASFEQISIEEIELMPASIDLVLSFFAIIHIDRSYHEALFTNIIEWLRPGGVAFLTLGATDQPESREANWHGQPMVWSFFDAESNLKLLSDVGFDVVWHEIEEFPTEKHLFVIARK